MRLWFAWLALGALPLLGAERVFQFGDAPIGEQPPGFESLVAGSGRPGEWKVALEDAPAPLEPLSSKAPALAKRAVVTQSSRDPSGNRFPLLVAEGDAFQDFKLQTRFKITGGALDQMAGIVFRFQNVSNFHIVAANSARGTFQCFKIENGQWKNPIGPEVPVSKDAWHSITVECDGPRIVCALNGQELVRLIDQTGVAPGRVGYATHADSVSCFMEMRVSYTERDILAQELIREALAKYPRLEGLQVYAIAEGTAGPKVVASTDPADVGKAGGDAERDVIENARNYYSRGNDSTAVTLPLRDRNGDPIAAVRVTMKRFPGQTQENALLRAQPIVRHMQLRVLSLEELLR